MVKLPEPYRWLEFPLQAWRDWAQDDIIGLGYASVVPAKIHSDFRLAAIVMPEPIIEVEAAVCTLPNKWRNIVKAEWIWRWPHWYTAKRLHISRPTHLAMRKHAYALIAERLASLAEDTCCA